VSTNADTVATALVRTWQHLVSASPNAWTKGTNGVIAAVTGVAISTLNGVWTETVNADPRTTGDLLDQVAAAGLPYCLQVRPGTSSELSEIASTGGMYQEDHPIPLMVMDAADRLGTSEQAGDLQIRELDPHEAAAHAQVAAAGFEAPVELMLQMMTPSVLSLSEAHCYLGEVEGKSVTTDLASLSMPRLEYSISQRLRNVVDVATGQRSQLGSSKMRSEQV
jgi:hypothetical protein